MSAAKIVLALTVAAASANAYSSIKVERMARPIENIAKLGREFMDKYLAKENEAREEMFAAASFADDGASGVPISNFQVSWCSSLSVSLFFGCGLVWGHGLGRACLFFVPLLCHFRTPTGLALHRLEVPVREPGSLVVVLVPRVGRSPSFLLPRFFFAAEAQVPVRRLFGGSELARFPKDAAAIGQPAFEGPKTSKCPALPFGIAWQLSTALRGRGAPLVPLGSRASCSWAPV
jgi:hypothetical protein